MAANPNDLSRPHVWLPAEDPASARTLLLLHGSGADEHDLLSLGKLLDPHANLLSPRGLVRVDGANRFFMRNDDGTFVEEDIVKNSAELAEFLWAASGEYGFDANNVYAVGFQMAPMPPVLCFCYNQIRFEASSPLAPPSLLHRLRSRRFQT